MDSRESSRKQYAMDGQRGLGGDKNANPHRRRMDSLSRLLHVKHTEVTAVGFDSKSQSADQHTLVLSVNHPVHGFDGLVHDRLATISRYAKGEISLDTAMQAFPDHQTDNYRLNSKPSQTRLGRDLKKVARSLNGSYAQDSGRNFSPSFADALHGGRLQIEPGNEKSGHVDHAEITVARKVQGDIGVSRLNCLNCYHDLERFPGDIRTRGTHGYKFPNLATLSKRAAIERSEPRHIKIPATAQYASDSDSGSDSESHSPRGSGSVFARSIGPELPLHRALPDTGMAPMIGPSMPPHLSPPDVHMAPTVEPVRQFGRIGPNPDIAHPPVFVPRDQRTTNPQPNSRRKKYGL